MSDFHGSAFLHHKQRQRSIEAEIEFKKRRKKEEKLPLVANVTCQPPRPI